MAVSTVDKDLTVNGTINATTVQQGGAAVALASSVTAVETVRSNNALGVVNHGSTAGTSRPSGFASIEWRGTVEPTNAIDGDTWIDTDA